jgi:hypothetical protein
MSNYAGNHASLLVGAGASMHARRYVCYKGGIDAQTHLGSTKMINHPHSDEGHLCAAPVHACGNVRTLELK